jgi:glycosyltransferase involved in cell wall biosynthesis
MPKEILIITPFSYPNIGGAESYLNDLCKSIQAKHNLSIVSINWKKQKTWKGTGITNFIQVFPILFYKSFKKMFFINSRVKQFDVIHAQGLISGLVAVLLKKIFKVKVFITLLALYEFDKRSELFRLIARFILNNCDKIFVEGENGLKDLVPLGRPYTIWHNCNEEYYCNTKVCIFQHWCDQEIFKPPEQTRPTDKLRILFIGRPIPEKGKHIVEEVERLLNDKEHYEFTYVEKAEYKDLPKYYQMDDVVIVPSLYAEGYSRVVIEAASCGCAVITSDRGSLPEMVKAFGLTFNPPNIYMILSYLHNFKNNNKKLREFQNRSLEYAKQNFNKKNSEVFLNEYERR